MLATPLSNSFFRLIPEIKFANLLLFFFERSSVVVWKPNQSSHITEQLKQIKLFVNMSDVSSEEPVCFLQWCFSVSSLFLTWHALQNNVEQQMVLQLTNELSNRHNNVYKGTCWNMLFLLLGGAGFLHLTADLTSIRSIGKWRVSHFHNRIKGLHWHMITCFSSNISSPRRLSEISLPEEEDEPMLLPPPDYSDDASISPAVTSVATPQNVVSTNSKFCCFYLYLHCRPTVPAKAYSSLLVSQLTNW